MKIKEGQTLVEWLKSQQKTRFPLNGKIDYYQQYLKIKEFLDINIHPVVVARASQVDGGFLTDHGTDHINMVIDRVSKLINDSKFKLTPYEAYLLLVAIQIHDSGHLINGRENHEAYSAEIIQELGKLIGTETAEKTTIKKIIEAHGGTDEQGDKIDKLGKLYSNDTILNQPIRPQLLAALLRFADELAEDSSRANRFLLNRDELNGSEIYHAYANSLHSVIIDLTGKQINLYYIISRDQVEKQLQKADKKIFLLDEIFERIYKIYIEGLYCMRYIPSEIKINTVYARIEFIDDDALSPFYEPISIKVMERGYPKLDQKNIYDICPEELRYKDDKFITGQLIKDIITT